MVNLPFGNKSPFTAEIWYVNKTHKLDVIWGTPSKIQLQDPLYKIMVNVSSNGQFGFKLKDSRKFLIKLVGVSKSFTVEDIKRVFKGILVSSIKEKISQYLVDKKISVLEINAHLSDLSEYMITKINDMFSDYGIDILNFYVNDLSFQDDDPGVVKLRDALAKQAERNIFNIDYATERKFDTLNAAASNEGSGGNLANIGVGFGIGGIMKDMVGDLKGDSKPAPVMSSNSTSDEILKLKKMLDDGILTQDEFSAAKKKFLGL